MKANVLEFEIGSTGTDSPKNYSLWKRLGTPRKREHAVNEEHYYPQLVQHMSDRDSNRGFLEHKLQLECLMTSTTDITRQPYSNWNA